MKPHFTWVLFGALGATALGSTLLRTRVPPIKSDGTYEAPTLKELPLTPLPNLPYVNLDEGLVSIEPVLMRYNCLSAMSPYTLSPPHALSVELAHRGPIRSMPYFHLGLRRGQEGVLKAFDVLSLPVHVTQRDGEGSLAYVDSADTPLESGVRGGLNDYLLDYWWGGGEVLAYRPDASHYVFAARLNPDTITKLTSKAPWAILRAGS